MVKVKTAPLPASFFERDALVVARDLIGTWLVRKTADREIRSMITETEAYDGEHDLASHARFGPTKRNEIMYGAPGVWYVYLCYGVHWLLNITVREKSYPAAVLIRSTSIASGPGRLTKRLNINKKLNYEPATPQSGLWIEPRTEEIHDDQIEISARIGIDYAKEWKDKPMRFCLKQL